MDQIKELGIKIKGTETNNDLAAMIAKLEVPEETPTVAPLPDRMAAARKAAKKILAGKGKKTVEQTPELKKSALERLEYLNLKLSKAAKLPNDVRANYRFEISLILNEVWESPGAVDPTATNIIDDVFA